MAPSLTKDYIEKFLNDGFVRIENAFDRSVAKAGRDIIWRDMGKDPDDPATWTEPVVRLLPSTRDPFGAAANTARLHTAFDQLVGDGSWFARTDVGLFVIRFPNKREPDDTGWHVDGSYSRNNTWFLNVFSKERALLMLFLFSDIGINDAPTRIRVGSHLDVPPLLHPFGEAGIGFGDISVPVDVASKNRTEALAVGEAGDVYLCHPFLVHAAQKHTGTTPRFFFNHRFPANVHSD